jgi:outer membrane protein OmpU
VSGRPFWGAKQQRTGDHMKKVLLATTALIAFGAVSANAAEPIKLGLGGYAAEYVGAASNKFGVGSTTAGTLLNTKLNTVDIQSDINVNFLGSTKLDNGITVGVEVDTFGSQRKDSRNVAYNGTAGNSDVKRDFITVSGAFGALIIGEREDALYIVHNSAPDVGTVGLQDGTWYQWVEDPANHRTFNATSTSRYDERTQKISYVTPAFFGFAAAASYVPNISLSSSGHTSIGSAADNNIGTGGLKSGMVNGTDLSGDAYGAGVAYTNTFGGLSIKADAGAAQANAAGLTLYQAGTQVSYAGFTLGGSILNRHVGSSAIYATGADSTIDKNTALTNAQTKTAAYAGQSFDVGLSYTTGPFATSVGYFHDTSKDDGTHALIGSGGGADSTNVYVLSGAYTMGPGVVWQNSLAHVQYKSGDGSTSALDHNSGNLLVTGIKVTF